jgi:hypothetical protein
MHIALGDPDGGNEDLVKKLKRLNNKKVLPARPA